ncbi:unnamed protein product [Orchesella dallaii]|uniref:Peptidase S1 domain-containing protein n=1 Tax=Orchesella dallaii TaxID=48710 RepID=A0ABP1RV76_9HEXA
MSNYILFLLLLGSGITLGIDTGNKTQLPEIEENVDGDKVDRWRIIGGLSASEGDFPYQILLLNHGRATCGGSFVIVNGSHFVVTAAHCVWDVGNPSRYTVVAGEVDRTTISGNEQTRRVTQVIRHSWYSSWSFANDIALLVIDEPFTVNNFVSPIPLPEKGQKTRGEVIVSGFGRTTVFNRRLSPILMQAQLTVLDDNPCRLLFVYPTMKWVFSSMLCAWNVIGGRGSCNGDSGGPLRAVNGNYLAAMVSWGTICAAPLQPGVYTEVSYFVDWIEQQVATIV